MWDKNLPYLSLAFNSAPHEAHKRTPSFVFLGKELIHPLTLHWNLDNVKDKPGESADETVKNIARELKATHLKTKSRYHQNRKPSPFSVKDLVLYRRFIQTNKAKQITNKLTQIWRGPFAITDVITPVNVKIQLLSNPDYSKIVYISQLKMYYERLD